MYEMIKIKKFQENYNLSYFNLNPIQIKILNIFTVYRTEQAHIAYKGQFNYGNGMYFSLNKEEAKDYTLDPHSTIIVEYDPNIHGKIDSYSVLKIMKVCVFNMDKNDDFNKFRLLKDTIGEENLNKFFLLHNVHGLVIFSESMNYGGNQLVVYNTNYIR